MAGTRNISLDVVKLAAAFMVVCGHVFFTVKYDFMPVIRMSVPLFFIISGYLLRARPVTDQRLRHTIKKIFLIALAANIFYFLLNCSGILRAGKGLDTTVQDIVNFVLFNESPFATPLWFLSALLYDDIIIWFFYKRGFVLSRRTFFVIVPLLCADLVFGRYSMLIWHRQFSYMFVRNFLCFGLPYVLIGMMLAKYKASYFRRYSNASLWAAAVFFAATSYLERWLLVSHNLATIREHYISTTFLSVAVVILAIQNDDISSKLWSFLARLGEKYSLLIYIMHPVVIFAAVRLLKHHATARAFYDATAPLWVFAITLVISDVLLKLWGKIGVDRHH